MQPKQVLIEAKILEVELTDDMTLGVQWDKILGDGRIATRFGRAVLPEDGPVSPLPKEGVGLFGNLITGAGTSHQFALALDVLQDKTNVNILSTPKILAIHGKPARVQVGGQQGYRVTTISNGLAVESIEFIDTGTILDITPHIVDNENILLDVQPSIDAARIDEGGLPVVKTTTVRTSLLAKSGQTIFIGGLIQDSKARLREQVPLFGDIPILGLLFRSTSRPTVVPSGNPLASVAVTVTLGVVSLVKPGAVRVTAPFPFAIPPRGRRHPLQAPGTTASRSPYWRRDKFSHSH